MENCPHCGKTLPSYVHFSDYERLMRENELLSKEIRRLNLGS